MGQRLEAFDRLTIDVSRTGYIRLENWGPHLFASAAWCRRVRVEPTDQRPRSIYDWFHHGKPRGEPARVDVVTQDPNRFLDNPKGEVFKRARRGYAIDERRIVPLGLKLIKEDTQGLVYYTSSITSEVGYQTMIGSSFGQIRKAWRLMECWFRVFGHRGQ